MLKDLKLDNVLFLDIETVPAVATFDDLSDRFKKLWEKKAVQLSRNDPDLTPDLLYERAGIYAEFGKVICISCGFFSGAQFRIKSYYGEDEKILLQEFAELLDNYYDNDFHLLCAHNGKEFDFPYLSRRMLINNIRLPNILNLAGKKPWEVRHIDTMELWKFGDFKHFTSLDLLTLVFEIPTPKDDIDGSMVGHIFWVEKDLPRIVEYCQKDVLAVAQLLRRYQGLPLIGEGQIEIV